VRPFLVQKPPAVPTCIFRNTSLVGPRTLARASQLRTAGPFGQRHWSCGLCIRRSVGTLRVV
jgi:hypothetical protein